MPALTSNQIVVGEKLVLSRRRLVHKPVDPKNLSKKFDSAKITDGRYDWQLKYDGCHMIVIKFEDGRVGAWSREGNPVFSMNHVLAEIDAAFEPETVLFGEAYSKERTFEEISGSFRRQSECSNLDYMVFDRITLDEFLAGESTVPYENRFDYMAWPDLKWSSLLFTHIVASFSVAKVEHVMEQVRQSRERGSVYGLDGFIAFDPEAGWIAGDGKGGEKIKVKNHESVDLLIVGVLEGEGKFAGTAGAIEFDFNGETIVVGCGTMTNEERATLWRFREVFKKNRDSYAEVHALGYTTAGKLREPRFHRMRPDKTEPST